MANGVVFLVASILGIVGYISQIIPIQVIAPILVYVGIVMVGNAFTKSPQEHIPYPWCDVHCTLLGRLNRFHHRKEQHKGIHRRPCNGCSCCLGHHACFTITDSRWRSAESVRSWLHNRSAILHSLSLHDKE